MTSDNKNTSFKKPEGYKNINVSASVLTVKQIKAKNY